MNLLTDPWVPVLHRNRFRQITYQELLCTEADLALSLPRDDMELAALQMLIGLTQAAFTPKTVAELRERESAPMDQKTFEQGIAPFSDWFVLDHPEKPFMQIRGIKAKDKTPIQKLFIGLPEGNNHAFFNEPGEVQDVCAGCASIGLFNQASACPSFGGGFKAGLRGSAPIATLIYDTSLRKCIWKNVLHQSWIEKILPSDKGIDHTPVWIKPIQPGDVFYPHQIGFIKGLFWQPAHVELILSDKKEGHCDCCGVLSGKLYAGFWKERFSSFSVKETPLWSHPHSPREIGKKERFLSFTTSAPAWTQLNRFLILQESSKEGHVPAPVVSQFREVFARGRRLHLIIGGYRNNKASVLQRRHEFFDLSAGWDDRLDHLHSLVTIGMAVKKILRGTMYGFSKTVGLTAKKGTREFGLHDKAEDRFFHLSESVIHSMLREMDWEHAVQEIESFKKRLCLLAEDIFNKMTEPYRNNPGMIKALAASRRNLRKALHQVE